MKYLEKNQKYILAGALVLVIAAVAVINFRLRDADSAPLEAAAYEEELEISYSDGEDEDYFAVFRAERDDVRSRELEYLDAVITAEGGEEETAEAARGQKLALVESMEKEVIIEGLLKAKGFSNAAVTVSEGGVNVVVDKGQLTDAEVAQVLDVTRRETGEEVENIKVLPLNSRY